MSFPGVKSIGNFDTVRSNFVNGKSSIPDYIKFNSDVPVILELTGTETTKTLFESLPEFSTNQKSISVSEFDKGAIFEFYLFVHTSETTQVEVGLMLTANVNSSKIFSVQIANGGDQEVRFISRVVTVTDDTNTTFFSSGNIISGSQLTATAQAFEQPVTTPDRSTNIKFSPLLYANAGSGGNNNDVTIKNFYFRRIC